MSGFENHYDLATDPIAMKILQRKQEIKKEKEMKAREKRK